MLTPWRLWCSLDSSLPNLGDWATGNCFKMVGWLLTGFTLNWVTSGGMQALRPWPFHQMGTADTHFWPPRAACARGCRGTSGIFSKRALAGLWQGRALAGPLDHTCLPAGSFAQPTPCLPLFPLRQPCQLAPAPSSYPSTLSHTASGLSFPLLHHSPSPAALAVLLSPHRPAWWGTGNAWAQLLACVTLCASLREWRTGSSSRSQRFSCAQQGPRSCVAVFCPFTMGGCLWDVHNMSKTLDAVVDICGVIQDLCRSFN